MDEDGEEMYDSEIDKRRYCVGVDGAHLMLPFQCEICMFRSLFLRDPRDTTADAENLAVLRRMNLDLIWSREPTTIHKNMLHLNNIISICESAGFTPTLTCPGPYPIEDKWGWSVAFAMLVKSLRPGRHAKSHTQYATIRKLRSSAGNLFGAAWSGAKEGNAIIGPGSTQVVSTHSPTNSLWFVRWSQGCEGRMGFIIKQNKAISIHVMLAMIKSFIKTVSESEKFDVGVLPIVMGLTYSVICFCASLRGSEGLKLDFKTLLRYLDKGKVASKSGPPHIIIPLRGRFKGEQGERCHLLPLANETSSGIEIRKTVELLILIRERLHISSPWAFVNSDGTRITFGEMNEIILDRLELLKELDESDILGIGDIDIREEYSINRSFRRGSSTHAQNVKVSEPHINAQNRWRKTELAKGRKQKFSMIENYGDIEQLIPTLVVYSSKL